jgi:hypothetical protein
MSVAALPSAPAIAPVGAVAAPLADPRKTRRDPRTGTVYILDKGVWKIDDSLTNAAAGRAATPSENAVVRKALGSIAQNTWRENDRSIEAVICTDTPCWSTEVKTGRAVKEVWMMDGIEFDPHVRVLNDHKRADCDDVLGSAGDFHIGDHEASGRMFISAAEPKICQKVSEGHIRDVSVGGERLEMVTIPPGQSRTIRGRTFAAGNESLNVVTRLRVYEVSFTPIGADPSAVTRSTSVSRSATMALSKHAKKFLVRAAGLDPKATDAEAEKFHDSLHPDVQKACRSYAEAEENEEEQTRNRADEEQKKKGAEAAKDGGKKSETTVWDKHDIKDEDKKTNETRSGSPTDAEVVRKALDEGMAAERKRVAKLTEMGQGLPAEVVRKAIDEGHTVEVAAMKFLEVTRGRTSSAGPFIQSRSAEKDVTPEVLGAALVIRSLNSIPSGTTGASFASDPTNLLGRYNPAPLAHAGMGDWVPDYPTRALGEVARKHNEQILNAADRYRSLSMIDICRHCCRLDGIDVGSYASPSEIVGAALGSVTRASGGPSGGSFGAIFTQNFNALFLAGYLEANDTTQGWCTEGDAPNFMPGELATVGKMGMLTLNGKNPADQLSYGDWNETIKVDRFSAMFEVDEKDLINDRFGALRSNSPQEIGLAARRVRPNLIYSMLLNNYTVGTSRGPTLNQDGNPLFCSAHSNFLTTANNDIYTVATGAVGVAGLQIALPQIKAQRLNGIPLNLTPRFALMSSYLDMAMRIALFSTQRIVASGSGGTLNPLQAFNLEARSDARMDNIGSVNPLNANAAVAGLKYHYILVCRPGEEGAKTVHVNYLLGSGRAPQIRSYVLGGPGAPGRWGIGWDVKLDVGAAVEDYRAMYYAESAT